MAEVEQSIFEWTRIKFRACVMLADGRKVDKQIAAELGIGRRTLARWKNHPVFADRRDALVERYARLLERQHHRQFFESK